MVPTIGRIRRRPAVVWALTALLAAAVLQSGISAYGRFDLPDVTLGVSPGDARALAITGERLLLTPGVDPDWAQISRLSAEALRRDATLGAPFRMLGFAADARGDTKQAERLVALGSARSRRDLVANLWLINRAVARDDVAGALGHFDTALRTSDVAPQILFPILSNAMTEPVLARALAARLRHAPWRKAFLTFAIDKGPSSPGLVNLTRAIALEGNPLDRADVQRLYNRLTGERRYDLLLALRPRDWSVGDPAFQRSDEVTPFAWSVTDRAQATTTRLARGGLRIVPAVQATEIVRRLVLLAPGNYRLSTRASGIVGNGIGWTLQCADRAFTIATLAVHEGADAAPVSVPADCRAQWLVLVAGEGAGGTVERLDVEPRPDPHAF